MPNATWLVWPLLLAAGAARGDEPTRPTTSATEADPAVPAPGHSVHGEAFDDGPRRAATIMAGQGKVDFPVTTKVPEAQAFFNQGVGQLHSFFYFEAERSFRQAARIDPDCVMASWGLAMANVNNAKRARGFLDDARDRAKSIKISRREQLYLDALSAFYKDAPTPKADEPGEAKSEDKPAERKDDPRAKARRQGLLLGLEAIVQEFPGDLDARAWLAMVTWQNGRQDGIGSRQAVDTLLESVERSEPEHPGVHHYRIHLWDGVKPDRALASAGHYASTAPGIAHAWHMPGHTYTGLKRFDDAAYQQEGSARVDHAYMDRARIMPFEIHNYAHNNQWLATSLSHVGRAREAIEIARDLVEQPRDPKKNGKNDGGSAQRSGRLRWAEVLVRYELWDALIEATTSGALDWSAIPAERKERAYTLGLAFAAKGDRDGLAAQIAALTSLAGEEANKKGSIADPIQAALAELDGHRLLAEGEVGPAFERFAKATAMRPEALARAHLSARNFGMAASTVKAAVGKAANQIPPLAAQVEVLEAAGRSDEAKRAYRKLEPLARAADPDLPVFRRLAAIVGRWEDRGDWSPPSTEATTADAEARRVDLETLGPLTWAPFASRPFALADTDGKVWSLADRRGKNVLVIFYLGGSCAHCMQQLQEFGRAVEDLKGLDTEVVAVGTDDLEATRLLKGNEDGVVFPMPLLADPGLEVFKDYGCHDDFEGQPLHGTVLIDARGDVRFQRISAEPFLDVDFVKLEAARVNRLTRPRD